jgi:thiamine monophosphate synthase
MQDKREREALEEQRRIQALSDEERRRLMVADMLERARQSQAYYAGQNVPTGA